MTNEHMGPYKFQLVMEIFKLKILKVGQNGEQQTKGIFLREKIN